MEDSDPARAPHDGGEDASARGAGRVAIFVRHVWEWTKSLAAAILIFLLIRTFVVEAFRIPTASMEETLLVGDFLLVNKAVYGAQIPGTAAHLPALAEPTRGDVIVFLPPHDPTKHYVKRLVGLPGDTLAMRGKVLIRNGDVVEEPYAQHSDWLGDPYAPEMLWQRRFLSDGIRPRRYRPSRDNWGPLIVPDDRYFVLGDNRDDSEDSRYWGFVDAAAVKGQPLMVYYSFDPATLEPLPWLTEIRWARIGGFVH
ncbi:MAG: signal peptidase I [Longimicrobiales bacterium]